MRRPKVLVISFSPIYRDARVLREIEAIARVGQVVSVGYGATPAHVSEHIEISERFSSLPRTAFGVLKLATRRFAAAELAAPATQEAIRLLQGRKFDVVVANDARAVPCAFAVCNGAPVWADLHEYAPEERTHVRSWRLLVSPFMDHICRKYLPRCAATTTVGQKIADLYYSRYGVRPQLVRNVARFQELAARPVDPTGPIRLVHSGAATLGRNLEATIEAVIAAGPQYTLDLYLVKANDGGKYYEKLLQAAEGCPRIIFHEPVKPDDLPKVLNRYDVGVFWIPPFNTNARLTLPNKIFDYIQARLAIAVGPTIEMQQIVEEHQLGVVSADYSVSSIVQTLQQITPAAVETWKANSQQAAKAINFELESETITQIIQQLASDTATQN